MSDYIPSELISNILARLQVEDLLRCTSVCKSWYTLITSPCFASLHLNLSNQEPCLLVRYLRKTNHVQLHRDNQTYDEIAKLDPSVHYNFLIVDCLHGLACFYDSGKRRVVLWNPSIRKTLVLPESRAHMAHTVGFGFVASSNDYKILVLSYCDYKDHAQIYQLSTGSWRDVKLEDPWDVDRKSQQAHMNGILHWAACYQRNFDSPFSAFIRSFDLEKEKFGTLMLPRCLRHYGNCYEGFSNCIPSTYRESLCLIDNTSDQVCEIWVMMEYGVADSWEKLFIINKLQHGLERFFYLRDNGEILCETYCKSPGKWKFKLLSYDCKNNQLKNEALLASSVIISAHTYVENLVLIKRPNEVKTDEVSTSISQII